MTPRTIRFKLDRSIQAAAVPSEFWAGSPFRIESAIFRDDGDIENTFSDVASFQLVIARQRNSATALVTKSVDVASLTACTAEEWDDGSGQHVAFDIASDESAVALTGDAERVWWEVRAILSGGGYDVLGGGLITANQDATADIAADAIAYYYTKAEVDALIAGAGGGGGSMTASQILTALKTVDGAGSGLDADLLGGQSAAAFATASHTHTFASLTSKPTTLSGYGITDAATSASVTTVANDLDSYIGDQLTWNTNQDNWNTSTGNAITALEARTSRTNEQIIRALKPLFWLNGSGVRCANFNTGIVDKWSDLTDNGVNASTASGYPTVAATRCNGRLAVTFADGLSLAATFPTIANLFVIMKVANNADNNFFLTNNTDTYIQMTGAATGRPVALWWIPGGQVIHGYRKTFPAGQYRLYTLRVQKIPSLRGTATPWLYTAGVDNYEHILAGNGNPISGMTHIGAYPGTTYDLNADVACVIGCGAMSQQDRDDMIGAIMAEYGLNPVRPKRFLGIGDSLMQGLAPVTATQTYPYYLTGDETVPGCMSAEWTGFNAGIGGWTTRDVMGGIHGILQCFSRHANNVAVISLGTNNYGITTPEQTAADIGEICRMVRAHKGRTLVTPMFPRGAAGNATYEPFRLALNPLLAALKTAGIADDYVDPASQPLLWADGANLNTTYFNADKTHLLAAGNSLWANSTCAAIEALGALPPLA